jgi:hypothetical protein
MARERWVVAVYDMDRHFGGPEEGGWWYDSGQLRRIAFSGLTEEQAYAKGFRFNHLMGLVQKRRKSRFSMAYAGGELQARIYVDREVPHYFPEERPYYE